MFLLLAKEGKIFASRGSPTEHTVTRREEKQLASQMVYEVWMLIQHQMLPKQGAFQHLFIDKV